MEALEREVTPQERFAAHSDGDGQPTAGNSYNPAEYERIRAKPLLAASLAIAGLRRTRQYIVTRELQQLSQARNLEEIKDVLLDATATLTELDIFDGVSFTIDNEPSLALVSCSVACSSALCSDVD